MRYALVMWGGQTIGQRPRTKMAIIVGYPSETQTKILFRLGTGPYGNRWAKKPRVVDNTEIIKSWVDWPAPKTIQKTKKALDVVKE